MAKKKENPFKPYLLKVATIDSKLIPVNLQMKLEECPMAYEDREMGSNHMFSLPQVEQHMKDNDIKLTSAERKIIGQLGEMLNAENVAYFRIDYR